ncbi:MAG TPA: GNAT family protein [Chitinophagales bacterium]|nr:GNAT family protein [Chitinophagales bacterium]
MIKFQRKNIETKRLLLQPYSLNYYKEVFYLIQKNKIRLVHSFPNLLKATETLENTKEYVQQKIFDWNKNKAYGFHIFYKASHQLIGHFNLKDIDWKAGQCELAYFIDENFAKNGLITEAMNELLKKCFIEIRFKRVVARIVTTNIASQKVVEKSGLKYEGAFYNDYTTYDNLTVDTYRYGISVEDFEKIKA